MGKIAVVGTGGYIGSNLLSYLKSQGSEVDAFSTKLQPDLFSHEGLINTNLFAGKKWDAVVYLSQSPYYRDGTKNCERVFAVNTWSPLLLAKTLKQNGTKSFVYLSTGSVYAPSFAKLTEQSPVTRDGVYPLSKLQAEEELNLLATEMNISNLRLFGIYGPKQKDKLIPNIIEKIKSNQEITLAPSGSEGSDSRGLQFSVCHVEDCCKVIHHFTSATTSSTVNVASPEVLSIKQLADAIGEQLGKKVRYRMTNEKRVGDLVADTTSLQNEFQADSWHSLFGRLPELVK